MADILIRGMEMPNRCAECWFMDEGDSWCSATRGKHLDGDYRYGIKDRPDWCPLIALPEGHGRLIDADALMERFVEMQKVGGTDGTEYACNFLSAGQEPSAEWYTIEDAVDNAPTIVPAEKEDT